MRDIILALCCAVSLHAVTITETADCTVRNKGVSTNSSCFYQAADGSYASASSSASLNNSGYLWDLSTSSAAFAYLPFYPTAPAGLATARATVSLSAFFQADGPVRAGYIAATGYGEYSIDGKTSSIILPGGQSAVPIILGSLFQVMVDGYASTWMDYYPALGFETNYQSASSHFQIEAFESDGITPVAMVDPDPTPEPSTAILMFAGVAALILWRVRRARAPSATRA